MAPMSLYASILCPMASGECVQKKEVVFRLGSSVIFNVWFAFLIPELKVVG